MTPPLFPSLGLGPSGTEGPEWSLSSVTGHCQWWGNAFSLWPSLFLCAADGLCCSFPWGSVQRLHLLTRIFQRVTQEFLPGVLQFSFLLLEAHESPTTSILLHLHPGMSHKGVWWWGKRPSPGRPHCSPSLPCWLGSSSQPMWKGGDPSLRSYLFPNAGY